jgi:hypothetical protein
MNYGEDFDLQNDTEILAINSPKDSVAGPYSIVFKHLDERWVIVALDYQDAPTLGLRWFWNGKGYPSSRTIPVWFNIPASLHKSILDGLPLGIGFRKRLDQYLSGEITGAALHGEA